MRQVQNKIGIKNKNMVPKILDQTLFIKIFHCVYHSKTCNEKLMEKNSPQISKLGFFFFEKPIQTKL
jgi:hypothetical protein